MLEDFLEIFKHSFHKLTLVGVRLLGKRNSGKGRGFYRFIGKFEFEPPAHTFELELEENKPYIIPAFQRINPESSNCFRRQFTKKFLSEDGRTLKKVDFKYVFDVVPANVIDFTIDESRKKMYLYVLGYGVF